MATAPADEGVLNDTPAADAAPQLSEVESLAVDMGWDPNFKGGNGKEARTAVDWIKSTGANNRNLKREMKDLKGSLERIASVADRQVKREVQEAQRGIEARFAAAVEAKDTQGAAKAAADMRELERENAPAPARDVEADFASENPWYGTNRKATAYAKQLSAEFAEAGITDPKKQLAKVVEGVKEEFPELFESAAALTGAKPQPMVNQPNSRTLATKKPQGFDDMPEVAKQAAKRFYDKAKMRGTAPDEKAWRTQYARDYFENAE